MHRGGRKKKRKFCLPFCFSAPSVWESEETEFPPEVSPLSYLTRLRSLSRTVPVVEIAGDGGEGHVEDAPPLLSPPGNREEKMKSKTTVQPHAPTSPSARTHHQTVICHVSTKLNSPLPLPQLLRTRDPVQNIFRTSHPLTPQPNRPAGPAQSPTRPTRRLDPLTGLLLLTATLTVILFFGRLCAVLCNCVWFYLLSYIKPPPSPSPSPAAARPPATEREGAEEVDVDSPAYKKKVVLMGLLERNRCGISGMPMTPLASPATARLR